MKELGYDERLGKCKDKTENSTLLRTTKQFHDSNGQ